MEFMPKTQVCLLFGLYVGSNGAKESKEKEAEEGTHLIGADCSRARVMVTFLAFLAVDWSIQEGENDLELSDRVKLIFLLGALCISTMSGRGLIRRGEHYGAVFVSCSPSLSVACLI